MSALQRYDFPIGGNLDPFMSEGGRFVLFSEAQALNAELLEALEYVIKHIGEVPRHISDVCEIAARKARQ